ncbi:hypothetical protein [Patulibacter sp.]|uniref:hypothetical protein n=1 Tax=Patulibacter sp. TaxID=1912859 RepID=UPI0027195109|nr:hypothetical protein [Patulibacter sp.]MDO9406772.1 hypothetical protein [Patulibacter sp.]
MDPRGLKPLVDHLRVRAVARTVVGNPPAAAQEQRRAAVLTSVVELLEEDPGLVRPPTRETLEAFVLGPVSAMDDSDVLGLRASSLVAAYGTRSETSSVTHLRLLEGLAVAVIRDAWEMAAEVGDVLMRGGSSPDELAAVVGLEVCETEAAIAGLDPGDAYFARRPELTLAERRRWIASLGAPVEADVRG